MHWILMGSWILTGTCLVPTGEDLATQPWREIPPLPVQFDLRQQESSSDPEGLGALAAWCSANGLFDRQAELLRAARASDHEAAFPLSGYVAQGDRWQPEELLRFSLNPDATLPDPPLPGEDLRRRLLRSTEREMKSSNAAYFALETDLDPEATSLYGRLLDRHFGRLKTRFRAYTGEKVEVLLFAQRSDYLRFYDRHIGEGGENVLGFHAGNGLYFYDDPSRRPEVFNTARHECTHLLIHRCFQESLVPRWLHEGMACYFAGDCEDAEGSYTAGLIWNLQQRLTQGPAFDLADLIELPNHSFQYPEYVLAWSWIYFLNTPRHEGRFQKFLKDLRERLPGGLSREDATTATTAVFREHYADTQALSAEWKDYFLRDFALRTPVQHVDFAWYCAWTLAPSAPKGEEHTRALQMARLALSALPKLDEEDLRERAAATSILCAIRSLGAAPPDAGTLRQGLRRIVADLQAGPFDSRPDLQARLAFWAAYQLRALLQAGPDGPAFDARTALLDAIQSAGDEAPALRALVVLFDDLHRLAREAWCRTLKKNPLHQTAVHDWLFFALDLHPSSLPALFPYLQFLVEADPDDRNLAALAAAYAGLGDQPWSRVLWGRARDISVRASELDSYRPYIDESAR